MKTTIHQLIAQVSEIKSFLGIHQELERLEAIKAEKIEELQAQNIVDYTVWSKASKEVDAFKYKYRHLLTVFLPLEETLEELEVFYDEFTSTEKETRLVEVDKQMKVLEVYRTRKQQGLPLNSYNIENCAVGYQEIDKFFQSQFGYPLLDAMKANEPVFTNARTSWDIRRCADFLSCKKQPICPNTTSAYLFTERTQGKLRYFPFGYMEQFFTMDFPDYYFIGYASNDDFYYLRADDWRKYYFRFNTGGAYSSWGAYTEEIGEFLQSFFQFEEQVNGKIDYLQFSTTYSYPFKVIKGDITLTENLAVNHGSYEEKFKDLLMQLEI